MANSACISFARRALSAQLVHGMRILEVGSLTRDLHRGIDPLDESSLGNPTGSIRGAVMAMRPREYVGIDLEPGPGVDVVCAVESLTDRFGAGSFNLVIASELLEHLRDWRGSLRQMAQVLAPGGRMLITTRSWGFPVHRAPWDYWRYEPSDAARIFPGALIELDPISPGIFVLTDCVASELDDISLRSILTSRRVANVGRGDSLRFVLGRPRLMASAVTPEVVKRVLRPLLPPPGY